MRAVSCKKMPASDGKIVVVGTTCPYCNKPLAKHVEIEDAPETAEAVEIEVRDLPKHEHYPAEEAA